MISVTRTIGLRSGAVASCCGVLIAAAATCSAVAAGCRFEPQGEGRVASVIDNRTFRLEDGREVRLVGIQTVSAGSAALAALIVGRNVTLHGETDVPDRWGRQPAFVFAAASEASVQESDTAVQGSNPSVQGLLLAKGEALVSAEVADPGCAAELAAAEAAARQAKLGTWAEPGVIKNAESPGDILASIGQFAVVEGKVLSVRQAGATFYVNFGRRWTQDFAATISKRMINSFEAGGITLKSLESRRVRVRGWVEQRSGPRIELLRVGQIEVVGENDGMIRKSENRVTAKHVPGIGPGDHGETEK
jgi:endonuclease YncB( thermonuclease family)